MLRALWDRCSGHQCMCRCIRYTGVCLTSTYTSVTHSLRGVHVCVYAYIYVCVYICIWIRMCVYDLTCKRGSVGQSEGLSIPRSSSRASVAQLVRARDCQSLGRRFDSVKNLTTQIPMNLNFIDPQTRVLNYF